MTTSVAMVTGASFLITLGVRPSFTNGGGGEFGNSFFEGGNKLRHQPHAPPVGDVVRGSKKELCLTFDFKFCFLSKNREEFSKRQGLNSFLFLRLHG